jgi:hypothetical protein
MALTLRFTAPSSDDRDWLDYTIVEDGRRDVGRLYEDRHSRPELRWFWSITVYINPDLGITTSGRAPMMNEAKEHFLRNWQKCRTVSSLARRPGDPVGQYSRSTFPERGRPLDARADGGRNQAGASSIGIGQGAAVRTGYEGSAGLKATPDELVAGELRFAGGNDGLGPNINHASDNVTRERGLD